ncbi:HAD-IA family hydrolase [Paenibacillus qinlingensis]|uniref:Hydrolase of the HAD superfamily n=1 Tax=Paenibacillus qinlingensis TaxID=1837343 RepID=A0ABU1P563_9BACL|nr:HAD-IA family hydrolase [Paenibacillus qinlingensis]MDR6554905.1 putative hydrolase of the HAD superfamily [Paenibacillus qinlingensis]
MARPQLVLDVAGVLVTNFSPQAWSGFSSGTEGESLVSLPQRFKEIKGDLWVGKMKEEDFWVWLNDLFPELNNKVDRSWILQQLQPLAAMQQLETWSQHADIHLLSNHRIEWLTHLLDPIRPYLKSATISSEVGCCKPNGEVYELVHTYLAKEQAAILFVDDQERNLAPARAIGWHTLLADAEGTWMSRVTAFINENK